MRSGRRSHVDDGPLARLRLGGIDGVTIAVALSDLAEPNQLTQRGAMVSSRSLTPNT
jgi:hypothetical protein